MANTSPEQAILNACRKFTAAKNYAAALKEAQKLLQMDAENIGVHRLLALLYGLNGMHEKAHMHYMLLVQFDETYSLENCLLVAEEFAKKNMHHQAALICMAAVNRLPDARLYKLASECFERAGKKEEAATARESMGALK